MMLRPSSVSWLRVATVLALTAVALRASPSRASEDANAIAVVRDAEPVAVLGASLPDLAGRSIAELALFRYDIATASFVPIPFQVDERIDHVFNPNTPSAFHELMYDVFHVEDGRVDGDDELVFLFGDAGPEAPDGAAWVAGAEATRYEITVEDPRPGAPVPERRAYLFTGTSLPRSPVVYVGWSGSSTSAISSSVWSIEFADRWVLNGYRVNAPCGTGSDLIDRVKGRAGRNLNMESEQEWNLTSTFLGSLVGPVRAIRYVRGAASGLNTVHHDVVYQGFWERTVNLRVHPIAAVALYVDLLPQSNTTVFTPRTTAGATVDGVPDFGVNGAFVPWALVRSPSGGYVIRYDVPASPLYATKWFYYRDDVAYNDAVTPLYDDDDHSSFGAQGVELRDLVGDELSTIPFTYRVYPLCSNVGDAELGAGYQSLGDNALAVSILPEQRVAGPVRTLRLARAGVDVVLQWDPIPGAESYRIFATAFADLPHTSWTPIGDAATVSFVDAGAAASPDPRHYSVVGLIDSEEGDW